MVNFGEKAQKKTREIWIKVVVMLLQLYYTVDINELLCLKNVGTKILLFFTS